MDTVKDIVIFAPSEAFASAAAELIQERALSNHIGIVEATGNRTLQYAEKLVRLSNTQKNWLGRAAVSLSPEEEIPAYYRKI